MSERAVVDPHERLIFAMGGGGFTMEPNNPLLDDFVLSLADVGEPRILFLPTASGDTTSQINAFRARFAERACITEQLSLFHLRETTRSLADTVLIQDIIYVGGGSMRNLLALWRAHELDSLLVQAWQRGAVLAGLSAGAQRVDAIEGELMRKRVDVELLGEGPRAALGGHDEAVEELRRVHRLRRGSSRGR